MENYPPKVKAKTSGETIDQRRKSPARSPIRMYNVKQTYLLYEKPRLAEFLANQIQRQPTNRSRSYWERKHRFPALNLLRNQTSRLGLERDQYDPLFTNQHASLHKFHVIFTHGV